MIVVAGGTGRLGGRLVPMLLASGYGVRVLARGLSGSVPDGAELVRGDVRDRAAVRRAVTGATVVVSAVQGFDGPGRVSPRSVDREGNRLLVEESVRAGADVVLLSITHASPDHPLELAREKYAAEQALRRAGGRWTVLRAAAYAELWIELMCRTAGRGQRPVVLGRGTTPVWWVSVVDVARVAAAVVADPALRGRTVDVVGPEPMSLEGLARAVMDANGWSGEPRRIAPTALRVGAGTVGRAVPTIGRRLRAALAMDALPPEDDEALLRTFPGLVRTPVSDLVGRATV